LGNSNTIRSSKSNCPYFVHAEKDIFGVFAWGKGVMAWSRKQNKRNREMQYQEIL
jgi:hypothetical protein